MRLSSLLCLLLLLPIAAMAEPPTLLFDQGHKQAFLADKNGPLQLSQLAEIFLAQGLRVAVSNDQLSNEMLTDFDALVISGAFAPHSETEIEAVLQFLKQGGNLAVMIHIGQPLLPLLHKLGVDVGSRVINEKQNQQTDKTIDINVTSFKPHPLTDNLQQFTIYGGWPLRVFERQGQPIATSSPQSWLDMNQDQQLSKGDLISSFAVVIAGQYGRGSFAVFADDAIFQNKFLQNGNKVLAVNLARWLKNSHEQQVEI